MCVLSVTLILTLLFSALFLFWAWRKETYWTRNKIPNIFEVPILGNFSPIFWQIMSSFDYMTFLYNHKNTVGKPFFGVSIFGRRALVLKDPNLIKQMIVRDSQYFINRHMSTDPKSDLVGFYNLIMIKAPYWKPLRSYMSPAFTARKLKKMSILINKVGNDMINALSGQIEKKANTVETELKEICARYTTDIIASTFFGIESNCIKDDKSEFRFYGRKIFEYDAFRGLQIACLFFMPEFVPYLGIKLFPRDTEKFLRTSIKEVLVTREASGEKRGDLIDTLIYLKKSGATLGEGSNIAFKDDILLAQAATFYMASFETTSSVLSFTLFEICRNPDVQEKLRQEIRDVITTHGDEISYETLMNEMPYMDMVISEAGRLYPVLPFLERQCVAPKGGYSMKPFHDYVIPDKMPILIPIYALQRDPKYFPNPDKFDPERFSKDNKDNINPYTYMPFGVGPRSCIGLNFGQLQMKISITKLLRKFRLVESESTPKTLTFNKNAFNLQTEEGLWVDLEFDVI